MCLRFVLDIAVIVGRLPEMLSRCERGAVSECAGVCSDHLQNRFLFAQIGIISSKYS